MHPVEVSIGGRVIKGARVFVTSTRVVAYREGGEPHGKRRPTIAFSAEITGEAPEARRDSLTGPMMVETSEGTVYLNRGAGCGCNSVLKTLAPLVAW
jgi:hypothetical protein